MGKTKGAKIYLAAKIMAAFLLTISPLIVGNIIMYIHGASLLEYRAKSSMNDRQEYISNSIENTLAAIYTRQMDITMNQDIAYLIDLYEFFSDYQRLKMIQEVQDSLDIFASGNAWIEDVRIYLPTINRTLRSGHSISPLLADYEELCGISRGEFVSFAEINGNFTIISRQETKEKIRYLMVVTISSKKIEEWLAPIFLPQNSEFVLASDRGFIFLQVGAQLSPEFAGRCLLQTNKMNDAGIQELTIDEKQYLIRRDTGFYGHFVLLSIVSRETLFFDLSLYTTIFCIFLLTSLVMILLFVVFFYRLFNRPIVELNRNFAVVCSGDFTVRAEMKRGDFTPLYQGFNYMVETIQDLIHNNYQQKILMQQAELRQLQAQVDPHFLHNSFLSICAMAQLEDYEEIQQMAEKLSKYYQYTTSSGKDTVPFAEEYHFVSLYADIQNIRFDGKISCCLDPLPPELASLPFPRFSLQTLVENSYKYGAGSCENGLIRVCFDTLENRVEISVQDNGKGFSQDKQRELEKMLEEEMPPVSGLFSTSQRIRLFYKGRGCLKVGRSELGGMKVTIAIRHEESGPDPETAEN